MKQRYRLGTNKYIAPGENFRRRFKILFLFLFFIIIIALAFLYDFYKKDQSPKTPVSKTTIKKITFDDKFISTPYFKFKDSEDWQLIKDQSTNNKFVFHKYLPNSDLVQHQLIVYINSTPPPLELAASRVLPVSINEQGNNFTASAVSDHCGKDYKPGELHKVMNRQINGSTLLCDPDQGQLRVVIAKTGGDYNLKLRRADGSVANYIIIYQNQKIDPDTDTIMQIANTFQST
jgi:hypothetical protein